MALAAAPPAPALQLGGYRVLEELGEGTFGRVSKVCRVSDGEILVWKELRYGSMSEKEKQQLVSEVNILRELRHEHIVRYYDRVIDRGQRRIYIVMEYCAGGDLASLIRRHTRERRLVEEAFIWRVLAHIASALRECHGKASGGKVLHRDLKPGNILLDAQGRAKLADFGLARVLHSAGEYARTHVGTPYYMSPEQVTESRYNEKSDIWSLGCLVYELAALKPPFRAANQLALAARIKQGTFDPLPAHYSADLARIVASMLCLDAALRPTAQQLLLLPQVSVHLSAVSPPRSRPLRPDSPGTSPTARVEPAAPGGDAAPKACQAASPTPLPAPSLSPPAAAAAPKQAFSWEREALLRQREDELERRERALAERARQLADREAALVERERTLRVLKEALLASRRQPQLSCALDAQRWKLQA